MIFFDFPYVGNAIIPTDELIFFRGVGIPPIRMYSKPQERCRKILVSRMETRISPYFSGCSFFPESV